MPRAAYNDSNFDPQKEAFNKYSRLSKCSIAREFGLSLEGPTKVKAPESFLFTEGSLKIVNKEHLFDFVVTLYFISL